MDIIRKFDESLARLRAASPLVGWSLTLILAPFALVFSLIGCLLLAALTPFFGLAVGVGYLSLEIIAVRRSEYGFARIIDGPPGNVIMALFVVVGVLLAALTLVIGITHGRP
jgi:hypothetical protein